MAAIQVLEHQRIAIGFGTDPSLSLAQASLLEKIARTLPGKAIEWGRSSVKFSQFCGVIALGDDTLEILPKIYGREQDIGESRRMLVHLLFAARKMKLHSGAFSAIGLQDARLLDIFIRQFCAELFQQLRQGMIRRYVDRADNLRVLRGKLNIDRHLRLNAINGERLYCEYDELVEDNRYNQIIKFVLARLVSLATSGHSKRALTALMYRFDGVRDCPASTADIDHLHQDRTMTRYDAIFEYCRWFLGNQSPDVVSGANRYLSLLFDMNALFEEFVAQKLKRYAWTRGFRLRTQGPQQRLAIHDRTDEEVFVMKPDISLYDANGALVAILDTKWKLIDEADRKLGVSQADLYQMVSYGHRYGCKEICLLYPKTEALTQSHRLDVLSDGPRVHVVPIDLVELVEDKAWSGWESLFRRLTLPLPTS